MPERELDLVNESDRGCVLVGAAILEERLNDLFGSVFARHAIPNKVKASLFEANGPLSTLSAKIKLAFALGLIGKSVYEDLENIRKIRNGFAHSSSRIDFVDDPVVGKIESLHCVQEFVNRLPRHRPVNDARPLGVPDEVAYRMAGYVKYAKSLFVLGVHRLEIELVSAMRLASESASR